MYSAQLSRKEPKKWDTIKGELVKIYALYFYIFVERNIKSTQKVHNTVDSKIELLVNTTEKQKRNNTNYYNHHHHQDSCVKFTYFHCIGLDVLKSNEVVMVSVLQELTIQDRLHYQDKCKGSIDKHLKEKHKLNEE